MIKENIEKIFDFLKVVNNLKFTYRYSTNEKLNNESTAAHTWMLMLLIMSIVDELDLQVDKFKAMKIALVHDLAEAKTGDIDYTLIVSGKEKKEDKDKAEKEAMEEFMTKLPENNFKKEIYSLWKEYNDNQTPEANLVKILDKVESQLHTLNYGLDHGMDKAFINETDAQIEFTYADPYLEKNKKLEPLIELIKQNFIKAGIRLPRSSSPMGDENISKILN